MSKVDLLQNEDFLAYQQDLMSRLDIHIKTLHNILIQPTGTYDESQTKLAKMEVTTALIAELEIIIGMPIAYLGKDKKEAREKESKKNSNKFIDMFRNIFTGNNSLDANPESA